ncbi:MAG: hypothetical protein H6R15_2961 [Proteobacteria bacterium]|nr:hypothetical protein [Pseudomonadota bacterium]
MPFNLDNANFRRIAISIPRERVNEYLGELWDEFSRSIGRVSCYQNYLDTDDPEVYEFCVCWSDRDLPFIAELSFFNHTAKGLTHVLIAAQHYETRAASKEFEDKIQAAIIKVAKSPSGKLVEKSGYLMVPFHAGAKLSGDYKLLLSGLLLRKPRTEEEDIDGHILFPLITSNKQEQHFEGSNLALDIAAALSVATQRHFVVSENVPWKILTPEVFQHLWDDPGISAGWIDDSGFTEQDEVKKVIRFSDPTKRIIEGGDCITEGQLSLPRRADHVLSLILNNDRYTQSCRRFHEGLDLRRKMNRRLNELYTISYELIAYVSAIEALLDQRKEKIDVSCPSCGSIVARDEWKISERFKNFVDTYSDSNGNLNKIFKQIYEDRSKFVHTGINLHNYLAYRPNRPLILMGKKYVSDLPDYYFNVHEFTGTLMRKFFYMQLSRQS